ncbi:hypothetical protein HDU86_000736 [Geranomyces michiganensis]|nr:hypothetical protein HDU86_000736 [Geranomyces michiganensis]
MYPFQTFVLLSAVAVGASPVARRASLPTESSLQAFTSQLSRRASFEDVATLAEAGSSPPPPPPVAPAIAPVDQGLAAKTAVFFPKFAGSPQDKHPVRVQVINPPEPTKPGGRQEPAPTTPPPAETPTGSLPPVKAPSPPSPPRASGTPATPTPAEKPNESIELNGEYIGELDKESGKVAEDSKKVGGEDSPRPSAPGVASASAENSIAGTPPEKKEETAEKSNVALSIGGSAAFVAVAGAAIGLGYYRSRANKVARAGQLKV